MKGSDIEWMVIQVLVCVGSGLILGFVLGLIEKSLVS